MFEVYIVKPNGCIDFVSNIYLKCSPKFNFSSKIKPMSFWYGVWITWLLLRINTGWLGFLILREKVTSWASLEGSGLKFIFHWYAQLLVFSRSLFRVLADKFVRILKISKFGLLKYKFVLPSPRLPEIYVIILFQKMMKEELLVLKRKVQSECTNFLIKMFSTNLDCTYIALGAMMQMSITTYKFRGIFRTQSNIAMKCFCEYNFKACSCQLFLQKNSITDVQMGSKVLDSQSRGPVFKPSGWLQGRLSLSSFLGW